MRFVPKQTKVQMTFYKGITIPDIIIGFIGLILVAIGLSSNLSFKYIITFFIGIVMIVFFFPMNGERSYKLILYVFKHIARQKKFCSEDTGRRSIEKIVPYNLVLKNGILHNKDFGFAGMVEIKPIDLRMLNDENQNVLIDGTIARAIAQQSGCQSFDLIKIERPLILDNYISDESKRVIELAEEKEKHHISDKEYKSRVDVVQDRIEVIDEINSSEKVFYSRYYMVFYSSDKVELERGLHRVVASLSSGGIGAKVLTQKEAIAVIRYSIDSEFDERNLDINGYIKHLKPKELRFSFSSAKQDGKTLSHFVINDYPLVVPNGWGEGLFDIANTKVTMKMKAIDKMKAVKQIDNAIIELETQTLRHKASQVIDRGTHLESLQELLISIQNDNSTLYETTIIVTVYDDLGKNANKKVVRRRLKEMGFNFCEMFGRQQDAWISASVCPINDTNISRGIPTDSIAACFPFISNAVADDGGILIGENKLPVFIDFFKRDKERVNSNMVIMGKPGTGKSYAAKSIIAHLATCNSRVFILDPEQEYTHLAKKLGGKVLDVSSSIHGKINPFHIITTEDEQLNDDGSDNDFFSHLQFLEEFYRTVLVGINSDSLELLNKVTQELYSKFKITPQTAIKDLIPEDYPTFDDLAELIDKKVTQEKDTYNRNCLKVLVNYIAKFRDGGRYSNLWNGHTTFAPTENFVVFNFQKLLANKNIVVANAQTLLVIKWLENEIIRNKDYNTIHKTKRKIIVAIDEAHLFIDEKFPIALDFMYSIAKRIRKYEGMVIIITQNVKDFAGTPDTARKSMAIINVSQYSLIFSLSPNDMTDLCKLYEHAGRINATECHSIIHNSLGSAFFISSPSNRTNVNFTTTDYLDKLIKGEIK